MISWQITRRTKLRSSVIAAMIAVLTISANGSLAQDRYETPVPKFQSPIAKLSQLQQKIKQKFSGFRRETNDQPAEGLYSRQQFENRNLAGGPVANPTDFRGPPIQQAQYQQKLGSPQRPSGYADSQGARAPYYPDSHGSNYPQSRIEPSQESGLRNEFDSYPDQFQTSNNGVPSSLPYENFDEGYTDRPIIDYQTQPDEHATFQSAQPHGQYLVHGAVNPGARPYRPSYVNNSNGHFDYGSGIQRQSTNRTQETATQRVLKLESENELLRSAKESLNAENQRLRNLLKDNRQLLAEIQAAIGVAQEELTNAKQRNGILEEKIAQLEREQKAQQIETARLLDSIRNNLDDVLMREMTGK
jgi:hypothetical protein